MANAEVNWLLSERKNTQKNKLTNYEGTGREGGVGHLLTTFDLLNRQDTLALIGNRWHGANLLLEQHRQIIAVKRRHATRTGSHSAYRLRLPQ